jgi:chromosome segregation ATPase
MQDLIKDHANASVEYSFCVNPKAKTAKTLEKKVAEAEAAALAHHAEASRRSASCQCDNLGERLAEAKRVNLEQAKELREADRKISGLEHSVKVKTEQLANMSKINVEAQAETRELKRKAEGVEKHWEYRKTEVKAAIAANSKPRPPKKSSPKKT